MTSNDECFYDANWANFARYDIEKMLDKHGLIDNGYGNFDDIDIVPTKDVMMKMFDKESNAAERRAAQLAHLCEVLKLKLKSLRNCNKQYFHSCLKLYNHYDIKHDISYHFQTFFTFFENTIIRLCDRLKMSSNFLINF